MTKRQKFRLLDYAFAVAALSVSHTPDVAMQRGPVQFFTELSKDKIVKQLRKWHSKSKAWGRDTRMSLMLEPPRRRKSVRKLNA